MINLTSLFQRAALRQIIWNMPPRLKNQRVTVFVFDLVNAQVPALAYNFPSLALCAIKNQYLSR